MVKSATDFLDMSEIDITFEVKKGENERFIHSFATQEQHNAMTELMYSEADETRYIVNRIRLEQGMWEPTDYLVEVEKEYLENF